MKADSYKSAARAEPKAIEKPLVEIKKGPKLDTRQKPLKTDFAQSYTTGELGALLILARLACFQRAEASAGLPEYSRYVRLDADGKRLLTSAQSCTLLSRGPFTS